MVRQTEFGFKLERTEEPITAHGGLALLVEFNHGLGLCCWWMYICLAIGVTEAIPRRSL